MQTRKLGYTELELTTVGLGTWAMGGGGWQYAWGPQDDDESVAAILAALDEGINWIDTAAAYGLGRSEQVLGKALRQMSGKPLVATKCGLVPGGDGKIIPCLTPESIRAECEESLKRLGVDVIDLYQIHWPDPSADLEKAWEQMANLVEEGKVRYVGVSNFSIEQMEQVQKIHPVASSQPSYSMLHREVEDGHLVFCTQNNIGVVVYSPMQRGLLTGKFTQERLAGLPLDDHRRRKPDFHEPQFSATLDLVEKLWPIAERDGKTLAQLAIAWVLRRAEVTSAIVGARKPDQIKETAAAGDWKLAAQDVEQIEQLLEERAGKLCLT